MLPRRLSLCGRSNKIVEEIAGLKRQMKLGMEAPDLWAVPSFPCRMSSDVSVTGDDG